MNPQQKVLLLSRFEYLSVFGGFTAHAYLRRSGSAGGNHASRKRLLRIELRVSESDRLTANDDLQVVCAGHGLRKAVRVADFEYAAHAQVLRGGSLDRQLAGAVTVELRRRLTQRRVVENQLAASPGCYSFDRRRIQGFVRSSRKSKSLAWIQQRHSIAACLRQLIRCGNWLDRHVSFNERNRKCRAGRFLAPDFEGGSHGDDLAA